MTFRNVALGLLLVLAGAILAVLLTQGGDRTSAGLPFGTPAYGQVAGFTQDFIGVTGRIATGIDAVYLVDTKNLTVVALTYDQNAKNLVFLGRQSLANTFGRPR